MQLSEEALKVLDIFEKSRTISMDAHIVAELQDYYQETYRFRFNASCGDCVAAALDRLIKDLKK